MVIICFVRPNSVSTPLIYSSTPAIPQRHCTTTQSSLLLILSFHSLAFIFLIFILRNEESKTSCSHNVKIASPVYIAFLVPSEWQPGHENVLFKFATKECSNQKTTSPQSNPRFVFLLISAMIYCVRRCSKQPPLFTKLSSNILW
jgi:hypothetical protein